MLSPQPDTSLHCETTNTGLAIYAVCLFAPQLSLGLSAPIHTKINVQVELTQVVGWLHTDIVYPSVDDRPSK